MIFGFLRRKNKNKNVFLGGPNRLPYMLDATKSKIYLWCILINKVSIKT